MVSVHSPELLSAPPPANNIVANLVPLSVCSKMREGGCVRIFMPRNRLDHYIAGCDLIACCIAIV